MNKIINSDVTLMGMVALLCLLAIFFTPAYSQNQTIRQSGSVTSSHVTCWTYNGIAQDCGTSTIPFSTTMGLYGTGTPFCINDVKISSTTISVTPYHQLCMGYVIGDTAAQITLNAFNGASQIPLDLIINGTTYSIGGFNWLSAVFDQQFGSTPGDMLCRGTSFWTALPPGGAGQILESNGTTGCPQWATSSALTPLLRAITSGSSDTALTTDGTIVWKSATALGKSESLYACNSGNNGKVLYIKDGQGTAGTYPITITPNGSDNIDGASTYIMAYNYQAIMLQCYGASTQWIVL